MSSDKVRNKIFYTISKKPDQRGFRRSLIPLPTGPDRSLFSVKRRHRPLRGSKIMKDWDCETEHAAKTPQEWLTDKSVNVLKWPSSEPDLTWPSPWRGEHDFRSLQGHAVTTLRQSRDFLRQLPAIISYWYVTTLISVRVLVAEGRKVPEQAGTGGDPARHIHGANSEPQLRGLQTYGSVLQQIFIQVLKTIYTHAVPLVFLRSLSPWTQGYHGHA